jgi:DNA-binding CsgD family transcriptional regulator
MQRGDGREAWPQAHMTPRESEILAWVAAGKSDWAIGRILNISGKTVNFHVENAKRKLGVATRVQAVVAALRTGIIG